MILMRHKIKSRSNTATSLGAIFGQNHCRRSLLAIRLMLLYKISICCSAGRSAASNEFSEYIEEGFSDEFYPQLWDTVEYGDAYAVPFNTDTQVIFYNKTLFKEAGISEEQLPQTWEELETVARKLDVKNGDDFERIGFYPLWNLGADGR